MTTDYWVALSLLCLSAFCIALKLRHAHGKAWRSKLPPGPKPLPLLGNVLQLTAKPHRALAALSAKHGPLMYLRLGSVHTLVVSSAAVATEVFLKHDLALSSRKVPDAVRALDHHLHSVAWVPVAPKWRGLRKISAIHLFTVKRLDATRFLRHRKVGELVEHVGRCSREGRAVEVAEAAFTTSLNLLWNTFFSADMASYDSESAQELKVMIRKIFDCIGRPNLADFFPLLRYFDPLRIRRDTADYFSKLFVVFDDIINERLASDSAAKDDVLQTLLEISKQDEFELSVYDIKHLLLDLIAAGTDTTSSTVEWAMTELLCNPSKLEKAQAELDQVLGPDSSVQESDIERLPYLQAVVKETMRMHPSVPLLLPHKAQDDTQLCGYPVPKGMQVLVNAWAIGRDPESWTSPSEFVPERFLEGRQIDVKGRDFELIPFGAGRRICLGMPLAHRMLHLMLAALLHGFRWSLADGLRKEDVDMDEKFGLSLQKNMPLVAVPLPKLSH